MFALDATPEGAEFGDRRGTFDFCRWFTMPFITMLKHSDTFAGNRVSNNNCWLTKNGLGPANGAINLLEIMAINFNHLPIEGSPFINQGFEWHNILGKAVNLDIIAIDNCDEITKSFPPSEHNRFPSVPRIMLAIRHEAIDEFSGSLAVIHLLGQRHAHGL